MPDHGEPVEANRKKYVSRSVELPDGTMVGIVVTPESSAELSDEDIVKMVEDVLPVD